MSDAPLQPEDVTAAGLRRRLRQLAVFDVALPPFDPGAAPSRPEELFASWLVEAIDAGVQEPHAMVLSTVDRDGRPDSRTLILKGLADGGWEFASSRASRKGQELEANPWAAAVFHWREQGRQVRLRGRVLDAGAQASARDFLARSPAARAETLAGSQSMPLHDPAEVAAAAAEAAEALAAEPGLVPDHWALFRLLPDELEFWQASPDRRHVRLQYRLLDGAWQRRRLWP